ncbi:MAG: hypothetical protein HQ518_17185 [Rhodopirellula sp.]|nr:hypothetical protein [Rhodopirellula sp.]
MGWEKRKSQSYFYLHHRLRDGRKVKEYFGRGVDAHIASNFLQLRKMAKCVLRQAMSELRAETQEADELLNNYSESVSDFLAAEMRAVGYHNSRSRGWRKMMKTDLNPEKEMAKDSAVSVSKKPRRSKGTTAKEGNKSKPVSSPASKNRAGSTKNSSGSAVASPVRSTAQRSEAKAKAVRDAAEGFRMESAISLSDNVGYSESPDTVEVEIAPPAKPVEEMSPEELIAAATEGDSAAMSRLRPMMREFPSRFRQIGDLGAMAVDKWLDVHCRMNLYLREHLKMHLAEMRAQHLAEGNSPIERLLIEEVLLSWLRHNYWISFEARSLQSNAGTKVLKFTADQTKGAQRMYLKAIAELRKFRNIKVRLPSATASSVAETD